METNTITLLGLILTLAAIGEGFVEFFLSPVKPLKPYLIYVALVIGVGLALAYRVDALQAFFGYTSAEVPRLGEALTGIIIGRGSNFVHDFVQKYLKPTD